MVPPAGIGAAGIDIDEILALLRAGGGRITATRRATVETLAGADRHLTAEQIAGAVRDRLPEMADSTVYRTLATLEELGVVSHVHLGHGPSTYHLVHRPHQHLHCLGCGDVIEVPPETFDLLAERLDAIYGFAIAPGHFALPGYCPRCRTGPDRETPSL